jgi:hypothetical protein
MSFHSTNREFIRRVFLKALAPERPLDEAASLVKPHVFALPILPDLPYSMMHSPAPSLQIWTSKLTRLVLFNPNTSLNEGLTCMNAECGLHLDGGRYSVAKYVSSFKETLRELLRLKSALHPGDHISLSWTRIYTSLHRWCWHAVTCPLSNKYKLAGCLQPVCRGRNVTYPGTPSLVTHQCHGYPSVSSFVGRCESSPRRI